MGKKDPRPHAVCGTWKTPEINLEHIRNIARVIERNNADVINLCEISDCAVLESVLSYMSPDKAKLYRPYVVEQKSTIGQHCGLLTKVDIIRDMTNSLARVDVPLPESKCPVDMETKSQESSKNYEATIQLADGTKFHMYGTHLLAFPDNPSRCHEREGQARVVRNVVDSTVEEDEYVVVMGDMNDFDPRVIPSASPEKFGTAISNVLGILSATDRQKGQVPTPVRLDNVLAQMDNNRVHFTSTYGYPDRKWSTIDHALIDYRLSEAVTLVEVPMVYKGWTADRCTDHFPVKWTLDLEVMNGNASREDRMLTPEDVPRDISDMNAFKTCSSIQKLPSDNKKGGLRANKSGEEMSRRVRCLQKSVGSAPHVRDEECDA
eukprot:GDKI01012832.1.p1 GENE.GDKI01012832.1~~GDKI01012832.1.p1  ORF type:complete len:377 (-),score=101.87 GDKI01012832.1:250-1380(-)